MKTTLPVFYKIFLLAAILAGFGFLQALQWAVPVRANELQATATPWWWPTSTVTPSPTPEKMEFTMDNLNSISPIDALGEMYMFGEGGSGLEAPKCDPTPRQAQTDRFLMEKISLYVCWTEKNVPVTFVVLMPDGKTESTTRYSDSEGGVWLGYQPLYNYPEGKYLLLLYTNSKFLIFDVYYSTDKYARLMDAPQNSFQPAYPKNGPSRALILDHFVPGERVILFVYKSETRRITNLKLVGWKALTIRGDGSMPVEVNLDGVGEDEYLYFAALGEKTGEVHIPETNIAGNLVDRYSDQNLFCPGAKPTRLNMVKTALVTYAYGLPLRYSPGVSDKVIVTIPPGEKIDLGWRTQCVNGVRYWHVTYRNNYYYAPEADTSGYLMKPVD